MTYSRYMMSKIFVEPSRKRQNIVQFYNIILAIAIMFSLAAFFKTHQIFHLTYILIAIYVIHRFKNRKENNGYYDVSGLKIDIDEMGMYLQYDKNNLEQSFRFEDILSISIQEQRCCLKLEGTEQISKKKDVYDIYIAPEEKNKIISVVSYYFQKEIVTLN